MPLPLMATFNYTVRVERYIPPAAGPARFEDQATGEWIAWGVMEGEAGLDAHSVVSIDVPVALLEYLRKSRSTAGRYRIGEAVFSYENDDLSRAE
jgi:hypothetical protein